MIDSIAWLRFAERERRRLELERLAGMRAPSEPPASTPLPRAPWAAALRAWR